MASLTDTVDSLAQTTEELAIDVGRAFEGAYDTAANVTGR